MNAQEASAFGAIEDRIAQLASDSMHLVNTNAVLQLRLEAMERRLHSDQAELQQARATLQATLREMDAAQRMVLELRPKAAKWDAVPVDAIRRYWNSDQYPQLEDDSKRIRVWLDSLDGDA